MKRLATAALLIAGFAAIVPAASAADPCLRTRSIDGFIEATTSSIVLTQGQKRWKADMEGACTDLENARGVTATARGACLKKADKIQYTDTMGATRTCRIATLTYQTQESAAEGAK